MKAFISFILIISLSSVNLFAQQIGKWRIHLSYHNATQAEPAGNLIYTLASGSLFSYDKEDTAIQLYDKNNYLSDTDISLIKYIPDYKTLVIVYSNGNIDLLVDDKDIYNLPDFKNKQFTYEKTVNAIDVYNEYIYLSTKFGIIVINVDKKEFTNTYVLNKEINACTVVDNKVFAASTEGLLMGLLSDNLLNPTNWEKVSDKVFLHLTLFDNNLLGNILTDGIYIIHPNDYTTTKLKGSYCKFFNQYNGQLIAGNTKSVFIFNKLNDYVYFELNTHQNLLNHLSYSNNTYWGSYGNHGLIAQKLNRESKKLEDISHPVIPNSPVRNIPYYMTFGTNRLLITGGGITYNRLDTPGTIMSFDNTNDWTYFQEEGIVDITGMEYKDITSIVQDPKDAEHHFGASAGEGLYEFREGRFVKLYNLDNSPLASALPNNSNKHHFLRINGLRYDSNNNLWMLNSETEHGIHVLKEDGNWVSFDFAETANFTNFEHTLLDRRGWLWATSMYINNSGIFCLNTNNTLENKSDDTYKFISQFINQEGTSLPETHIYCIAEDKSGSIWIGTDKGPLIINSPTRFFENNFYFTQIKVPRNDGSNLADYLLANDIIKAIAIDGANRKWIGTESNGLYLISEDGLETIHHFTPDNSPLLSNSITSIAIHPATGEVFIGTSNGLVSYQSDAVEAENTFADKAIVYPNPVRPGYEGLITVKGLVRDSDVKIIDVSGNLIHSGKSSGGMFTWDGKNQQGRRVASGIYYILAANQEGTEGVVGKIMVIK